MVKQTKTEAPTATPARDLFTSVVDDGPAGETSSLAPLPQEVLEDEARDREILARTASLMAQASMEPAKIKNILDNRELILNRARAATIKGSRPLDWTLWKGPEGDVVATPRDSLMVFAKKIYGITINNYRPRDNDGAAPKIEQTDDFIMEREGGEMRPKLHNGAKIPIFTATMSADGYCHLTGETLPDQSYTARTGRFAGQELFLSDLRQSCRTGLDKLIVSKLTGIRKVSGVELLAIVGNEKFLDSCYKGSGFGTSNDRASSRVAEDGVDEQKRLLSTELVKRTGGQKEAIRQLTVEISKGKNFNGFDSVDRMTKMFQIEQAWRALKDHPTFGGDLPPGAATKS
jgi:hypothetical protein